MTQGHDDEEQYKKVTMVVDSGAVENVASRRAAPHVEVRPSAGSRRGQVYTAANGGELISEGQQMTVQT